MSKAGQGKQKTGDVQEALANLSGDERERLVRALAEIVIDEIKESRRVDGLRRLDSR